jgi:hypothetical protein
MTGKGVSPGRAISDQEMQDREIDRELAGEQPEKSVRVTVAAPHQVTHGGKDYGPGEHAEVPASVAQKWIANEWVHESKRRK